MVGCAINTNNIGKTGNSDTSNTNSPWEKMPKPWPRRSVAKKSTGHMSRSRRSKRASVWWDELRHQPGPGGPIPQPGKWVQHPKARKTGPLPLCLSLDTSQECRDYKRVVNKSWPWRGVWTRRREPSHSSRLASPPAEDQPGGPRVSRGTRNTTKTNKNKKTTQDNKKTKTKNSGVP